MTTLTSTELTVLKAIEASTSFAPTPAGIARSKIAAGISTDTIRSALEALAKADMIVLDWFGGKRYSVRSITQIAHKTLRAAA